ncbi:MAG TPA: formylmethanofuran dehydrogenase [Methylomirabilota bacterium]|nr:formylmethanofuran dehydrogenase [Methylomirabilota bacterium]
MPGVVDSALRRNVACPFCGLGCDDLTVAAGADGQLAVRAAGCDLSRQGFERRPLEATARIAGRAVERREAVAQAAAILAASRQPLIGGLATDVDGVRAAVGLAERIGGIVDHFGTDGLFRNLRVLQDNGWMTTTLGEVRNHMDCLLMVGPDPLATFPRFLELCVAPTQTLYDDGAKARRLFRLGPPGTGSGANTISELPCPLEQLPEAVSALRCLIADRRLQSTAIGGLPIERLREAAESLKAARYGVVVWAAAAFGFPGGDLMTQSLVDLVRDLNQGTRAAALPLTGSDNLLGANQVCTWQSGVPLRTSFAGGVPRHDSHLFAASRLLAAHEVDALVWISSFRAVAPPPSDVPTIALVATDTPFARPPEVVLPVGTPGVDHAGQIFRTDGVVAMPVAALRDSRLPSVADTLAEISKALDGGVRA